MTEAEKQQHALDVLKSLNAAVTTTKLYPPSFPQVGNAVEDAYEKTRGFLRTHGELSISLVDDQPLLCGHAVNQKTLGKTHGNDIFQQLRLLRIDHVVLHRGLPRKLFQQILVFFTTSPQLVVREGGGRAFVDSLNLRHIFPEHYSVDLPPVREDLFALQYHHYRAKEAVTEQLVASLSSELDSETLTGQKQISSLADILNRLEDGGSLALAGIAGVLRGVSRNGEIFFPHSFELILQNIGRYTSETQQQHLASAVATTLVSDLDAFALHLLLLQNFPQGFGDQFYVQLLSRLGFGIDEVVACIREEEELIASTLGEDSSQYRQIVKGRERLLATERGKQFLAREKTRKIIETGEKERQAKRVQKGINALLQGDVNSLRNTEVLKYLPSTIASLISRDKDRQAATIIETITTELIKGETASHELLSESLSRIGESLVNNNKWGWLDKLSVPLMAWVKSAERADAIFEKIINILQRILTYYWENGEAEKADRLLMLLFAIRTGKVKKPAEMAAVVARAQDLAVEKATLPQLLAKSLETNDALVDRRLVMQGPVVARYLLHALFLSEKTEDRMKILELLVKFGKDLVHLLLEKLHDPMPWHDRRNLIHLLAETGGRENVPEIYGYLNHDDIRVQKEAFSCIYKISGEDRKNNLLKVLSLTSGLMRGQAVKALMPLADDDVVAEVGRLLLDWQHFSSETRDALLMQISDLLGKCRNSKGEEILEQFLQNEGKGKAKQIPTPVWQSAKSALRQIKAHNRELQKQRVISAAGQNRFPSTHQDNVNKQQGARSSFPEEKDIEKLLAEDEKEKARKLLVDLICRSAELKRFDEAERLRDWLIGIDPMALNDIIRAAEIIENQKTVAVNPDFLEIWSKLCDNLTTEEFNALYYGMEHSSFPEETVLARQGAGRPVLYFINHGQVKLYYNDNNNEVLIKVAHQGQVIGMDTFFDASVWTMSAAALSNVQVSSLHLKKTKNWPVEFPAVTSKLHDFCKEFNDLGKHLTKLNKTRRDHERAVLAGRISIAILDNDKNNSGIQITGELADISSGGLSCIIRISQKKNARILLGRNATVHVSSSTAQGKVFQINGILVNVKSLYSMNNEYSAHVKFGRKLTREELTGIIEAGAAFAH